MNNKQIQKLYQKLAEEKYEEIVSEIKELSEKSNGELDKEFLKILGLSYFRQEKYDLAEEVFVNQTKMSNNPDDWFNLLTASTMNKDIHFSEEVLKKTLDLSENNLSKDSIPIPYIYFYYMQALRDVKEYEKAFEQLEKMKKIYSKFVITDATFLYLRGVPFFEGTLEAGKEILENIQKDKAVKFIEELRKNVDEEGRESLEKLENRIVKSKGC